MKISNDLLVIEMFRCDNSNTTNKVWSLNNGFSLFLASL